jgi:mRNA interferase MazF
MNRGDLVTIALPGDYGKPRPALIIQSDLFGDTDSVTLLLLSSTLVHLPLLRIPVRPSARNGLRAPSEVMIDKPMTVRRDRVGPAFGRLEERQLLEINRALALFLGLA